jgi:DNA polymerase-3 subunit gamma/tau
LKAGRVAHAYIFSGPRGIGKTTTARLLAKAINCEQGPTADPCNACLHCQEISEGRSLDVLEIDGASNRGVGEIRNLRENIRFNPVSSRKRIYIIDEVHMLTIEAFNALLKTLEEPPEHAVFIFATTEINRVPATILSRCQRFDFRRLSTREIQDHLRHICDQEGIRAEDAALELLARRADGAMRDAQSLLDQMATFAPEGISAEQVRTALGVVPEDLFFKASDLVFRRNTADVFAIVAELDELGYSPREFIRGLSDHFLNFIKAREPATASSIEAPVEVRKRYEEEAKRFDINDLLRISAILQDVFTDIRLHPQPKLKLELTLLRLATLERTAQIEELLKQLRGGEASPSAARRTETPAPAAAPERRYPDAASADILKIAEKPAEKLAVAPSAGGIFPLEFEAIRAHWSELVDRICNGRSSLACQLRLARPVRLEEDVLVVSFGADLHDMQLERLQKVAVTGGFDEGMTLTFGKPVRFRFERHEEHKTDQGGESQEASDPLDQELVRTLGATRIS